MALLVGCGILLVALVGVVYFVGFALDAVIKNDDDYGGEP